MLKIIGSFVAGIVLVGVLAYTFMGSLMFWEIESPFGVEETTARIQQNIMKVGNGWSLSGLRNPGKAVEADGGNTLPVLMVEACSTKYSGPILKDDSRSFPLHPDALQDFHLQEKRRQNLYWQHECRPDGQDVRPHGGRSDVTRRGRPGQICDLRCDPACPRLDQGYAWRSRWRSGKWWWRLLSGLMPQTLKSLCSQKRT